MAPAVVQAYMDRMVSPAYPGTIDGYGFLTWLNVRAHFPKPFFTTSDTAMCDMLGADCCYMSDRPT